MKIAMITDDYLPNIGGVATHVYELSRALSAAGHEIEVWVWRPAGATPPADDRLDAFGGAPLRLLGIPPGTPHLPPHLFIARALAGDIARALIAFPAELLHVHTLAPLSLSMRFLKSEARPPRRILTNHSSAYLNLVSRPWGGIVARLCCGAFDGVLAPSRELLEASRHLGVGSGRMAYIPNGVDVEKFAPADRKAARMALGIDPDRPVIVSTRRIVVKNGLRFLVEALTEVRRQVPDVLCVFCGNQSDDVEMPALQRLIERDRLEENVRFEGAVPNTRIGLYLDAADVVALPSLIEATSISGLEAMAKGRVLVGTRVGGIPDLIEDGVTGYLVEPRDPAGLARALTSVLTAPTDPSMERSARARAVERFSWPSIAERTLEFYRRILDVPAR